MFNTIKADQFKVANADSKPELVRLLSDEQIIEVVSSEIKKRKDAIVLYEKGNRPELAEREKKEIDILKKYLPEQLSEDELKKLVEESIKKTGAKEMKDMDAPYGGVATMENPFFRAKKWSFRRFVKTKVFVMDASAKLEFKHTMCHDSYMTALAIARYGHVCVNNYLFYRADWYQKGGLGDRKAREAAGLLDQLNDCCAEFPGLVALARGKNSALRVCKVTDSSVDKWRREHGYL